MSKAEAQGSEESIARRVRGPRRPVGDLRTFRLVFPERFAFVGLDRDVEKLVDEHNAVFVPSKA